MIRFINLNYNILLMPQCQSVLTIPQALITAKAGYAFQFFGDSSNGFQVIPYLTYTYGTTMTNKSVLWFRC